MPENLFSEFVSRITCLCVQRLRFVPPDLHPCRQLLVSLCNNLSQLS